MTWLEEYMASLTERERQVVLMLSNGMAPKQIARQLGTKPATVRVQVHQARKKANCATVIELAVKVATKNGNA
jgi:RNA polymerase sigma factor (sigma-70 family)